MGDFEMTEVYSLTVLDLEARSPKSACPEEQLREAEFMAAALEAVPA